MPGEFKLLRCFILGCRHGVAVEWGGSYACLIHVWHLKQYKEVNIR